MKDFVYLDHQAASPVDPRVLEAMAPFLADRYGNPASGQHAFGWDAEQAVETARAHVADLIGAAPRDVVFTSGGAEADNLAIKGTAWAREARGRHVITSVIERASVRESCAWLAKRGFEVSAVGSDAQGRIDIDAILEALRDDTILVSLQIANHEVGTLQPLAELATALADHPAYLHTDAAAAAAWIALDVQDLAVDLLSLSGGRLFGPKGIGALYVRGRKPRVRLEPLIHGGGGERGRRGGALNVPGAVGLGRAAEIAREERQEDSIRVAGLRDHLEGAVVDGVDGTTILGSISARLPDVSTLTLPGVEAEALLLGAGKVAFGTGSACASATMEPSPVLRAMGVDKTSADSSVRFVLGRRTTQDEVRRAASWVVDAARRIRSMA